ncbi:hypothetical protein [Sinorhizobium meliloti]|uniref:hypothetical protein n=1 Tax=Rhizobium meliloti TaxID=382 RepID=UPI000FE0870F|nr:hypothetical protein [Sinorhizobium meliloti]MDX0469936.1 hypothetical protein [Sinorhizobium medicae]MDX1177076.1 hypothetical protein [Sinorhizobium medicae]MDX1250262.1 hypothetical protein [Sinorhizobium medicae]RVL63495.1 hypothetical protein CN141_06375 [Sinorhizobium meliloti]
MWDIRTPPAGDLNQVVVDPVETLYEFDGPLIFRTTIGMVDLLMSKVTAVRQVSIFLACQTDDRTVQALRAGRLSVFGAFDKASYWLIALDEAFQVKAYWNCSKADVPKRFFAKPGLGLFHWQKEAPDSLEQAFALLAIKFKGAELTESGIPFGKLKRLVDQSFETVRKLLTPPQLANTKSSTFDLEVAPLKFASLVVAVREPVFNMPAIRRIKALDSYSEEDLENAVQLRGREFAEKLVDVQSRLRRQEFDDAYTRENFAFLDLLASILPDEDSYVSSVEFNASTATGLTTVVFEKDTARSIHQTVQGADGRRVVETGIVSGVTVKSSSIRIQSIRGKDVTCIFDKDMFDELTGGQNVLHRRISLTGVLTRRPRRDLLEVENYRLPNDQGIFA